MLLSTSDKAARRKIHQPNQVTQATTNASSEHVHISAQRKQNQRTAAVRQDGGDSYRSLTVLGSQKRIKSFRGELESGVYDNQILKHKEDVQEVLAAMEVFSKRRFSKNQIEASLNTQPYGVQPPRGGVDELPLLNLNQNLSDSKRKGRNLQRAAKSALGVIEHASSDDIQGINATHLPLSNSRHNIAAANIVSLRTEASPIQDSRNLIRSYKEQTSSIEGRIKYLQTQDHRIKVQVDKARMHVNKKKVALNARKLHEKLVLQEYERKAEEQALVQSIVAERKEAERKSKDAHANYLLKLKKKEVSK